MWDSFTSGVAISSMRNDKKGEFGNDFAELEYMNITVITSNKPYDVHDGSNPLFDGRTNPKFGLQKGGVHSGHVQTGIKDSFCHVKGSNKGRCEVLQYSKIILREQLHNSFFSLIKKFLPILIKLAKNSINFPHVHTFMMLLGRQR